MPAYRTYEYVVYPECRVSSEGTKVEGTSLGHKASLDVAKALAKEKYGAGAGIYSVTHGRFVGWITFTGRYSPFGRGR